MKEITLVIIILIGLFGLLKAELRILDTQSGEDLSLDELSKRLSQYDIVYFGEIHDDTDLHQMQAVLLEKMHALYPELILSMEMFERDVQPILDSYLAGEIAEADFLASSRPWPNYPFDYRPLVDYAKEHGLYVLAANIPRYLASLVARGGIDSLNDLSEEERVYMAAEVHAKPGLYKDRFLATMQANMAHGMPAEEDMLERIYYAQCMKDDTMAESILDALSRYPQHKLLHINGDFHSQAHLGTVERLALRSPQTLQAVISPVYTDAPADWILDEQSRALGDFLIIKRAHGER